jgi:lysozyme
MKRAHHKHRIRHFIFLVLVLVSIGFYLGQTQEEVIPEETSQAIGKVLSEATQIVADKGQEIVESTEAEIEAVKESLTPDTPKSVNPAKPKSETPNPPKTVAIATSTSFKTNQACVDIIKTFEGVRLEAYRDPGGTVVIGYGHANTARMGMKITQAQAEELLKQDLTMIENDISPRLERSVNANQFSAMVCLAYNIGTGAFSKSTVLRETNNGNWQVAADAFLMWNKMRVNGEMVVSSQLDKKRRLERALYLKQDLSTSQNTPSGTIDPNAKDPIPT